MLLVHLYNHEGLPEEVRENRIPNLHEHLKWDPRFAGRVVGAAGRRRLVEIRESHLFLTDSGRRAARKAMVG
jgi:manganese/zinc/iron transport system permease protein